MDECKLPYCSIGVYHVFQACEVLYDPNFDYNELYSAVIELMGVGSEYHLQASQNATPFDHMDGCSIHYTASVCWRLLGQMAPSVAYIKLLEGQHCDSERPLTQHEVLHSLRWVPRMPSAKYKTWIKVRSEFDSCKMIVE